MADMEDNKMLVCDQCQKKVAASNFALHESHCQRFLCLCPDCQEPVPRELLELHRQEEHSQCVVTLPQVKCTNCNKKMERCQLLEHELVECEARLQPCEFCQLELPLSAMAEHSKMCGSRTECCLDCGRYITLRDQRGHAQVCPDLYSPGDVSPPSTNTVRIKDDMSFPLEKMKIHQLDPKSEKAEQPSPSLTSSLNSGSSSTKGWRQERDGNLDQINTCPYCHLALPLFTLQWHEAKCQIHVGLK
uniref:TRAF-type domain-containing protein n=1 Tax=Esox lucius TaxID=8010 RepID=A0A3P8Y0I1_ESOLU